MPCTLHPTPSHTHILHGDGCEGGHGGGGGPGGQRGLTGDQRTKINALNLAGDRIVKYLSHFSDIRGGVAAEGFQLPQRTLKSPRLAWVLLLSIHAHAHARHVPASHARHLPPLSYTRPQPLRYTRPISWAHADLGIVGVGGGSGGVGGGGGGGDDAVKQAEAGRMAAEKVVYEGEADEAGWGRAG